MSLSEQQGGLFTGHCQGHSLPWHVWHWIRYFDPQKHTWKSPKVLKRTKIRCNFCSNEHSHNNSHTRKIEKLICKKKVFLLPPPPFDTICSCVGEVWKWEGGDTCINNKQPVHAEKLMRINTTIVVTNSGRSIYQYTYQVSSGYEINSME